MRIFMRLPALPAACALLLLAVAVPGGTAQADTRGADTAHAMSRDNPSLIQAAIGRGLALRPRAREEIADAATTGSAKLDLAALDAMPAKAGGDDWRCLAEAIYHESRGEPLAGQIAVAEVVLNRVDDQRFPDTVCGVTNQGAASGRACQFSYACDGRSDVMKSAEARIRSEKLASLMLAGRPRTVTDGATYFHTRSVRPGWARKMTRTAQIGHHLFYRPGTTQVASR